MESSGLELSILVPEGRACAEPAENPSEMLSTLFSQCHWLLEALGTPKGTQDMPAKQL